MPNPSIQSNSLSECTIASALFSGASIVIYDSKHTHAREGGLSPPSRELFNYHRGPEFLLEINFPPSKLIKGLGGSYGITRQAKACVCRGLYKLPGG